VRLRFAPKAPFAAPAAPTAPRVGEAETPQPDEARVAESAA
jgi:hypothetical protein